MNFNRLLHPLYCCIFCLSIYNCGGDNTANEQHNTLSEISESLENPYPAFSNFPNKQFKAIVLGETSDQLVNQISKMPVTLIAEEEDNYFYFPSDSTELIVPNSPILTEFKVFLRSRYYLDNRSAFYSFLSQSAQLESINDTFNVYHYETENVNFRITLFSQNNFIRIHFLMTKLHS